MTLTQVSTWFANARRRLKKENKWSPDGSCDDGSEAGDSNSLPDSAGQTSRLPSTQPSTLPDESGYSSSDRDAGSPHPAKGESPQKSPEVVTIPSRPVVPELPAHLTHLHPYAYPHALAMSQMMSQSLPEAPKMPRFLPSAASSPPKTAQKRAARSLWSIADITSDSVEDNEEVDVTA